jgi:hypothetical protein
MEHFEKQTISPAAKKQTRCHRYVDNTFVVWPHGKYELQSFLKHLNSVHQNIAFTMEVEQQGTLPLLDVLVKRRLDDSLGHSVYKKPIHTDLNLHAKSEHHPSKKRAVLSTLVRRAKTLCDPGTSERKSSTSRITSNQRVESERHQAGCTPEAEDRTKKGKAHRHSCTPLSTNRFKQNQQTSRQKQHQERPLNKKEQYTHAQDGQGRPGS